VWRPLLDELGRTFTVTRYDQRGNGLSDWSVDDFSLEHFTDDLEAVVDTAGLDDFVLYGTSQGAPIAIAYAVRHPHRVSHLVLQGGYSLGRLLRDTAEREQGEALLTLIRHGWGKEGSPFIKAFTANYIPGGNEEQTESLVELQKRTTSPENAVKIRAAVDSFDVTGLLEQVAVPTLVIHARNDGVHPLDQGRKLAAEIPGAEFVLLESLNHVILAQEPAWNDLFEAIRGFVSVGAEKASAP
jgi:pimeloyl-ACP methyl ester carboxylesterase